MAHASPTRETSPEGPPFGEREPRRKHARELLGALGLAAVIWLGFERRRFKGPPKFSLIRESAEPTTTEAAELPASGQKG